MYTINIQSDSAEIKNVVHKLRSFVDASRFSPNFVSHSITSALQCNTLHHVTTFSSQERALSEDRIFRGCGVD
jgi:hypothetical protein